MYPKYKYTLDDIRVIVGHCPQFMYDPNYGISVSNSTFETITNDGTREILNGRIKTGIKNSPDMLFGISMECDKITNDREPQSIIDEYQRYIYKVDVGSTRAFDNPYPFIYNQHDYTPRNIDNFINEFGSRVPQVLEIQGTNDIRILRSTLNNTRIHQPRETIENHINNSEIDIWNIGGIDKTYIPKIHRPYEHRKYILYGGSEAPHPSLDISFTKYLKYDSISFRNRILEDIFFKKYILYKKKYLKLQTQLKKRLI